MKKNEIKTELHGLMSTKGQSVVGHSIACVCVLVRLKRTECSLGLRANMKYFALAVVAQKDQHSLQMKNSNGRGGTTG